MYFWANLQCIQCLQLHVPRVLHPERLIWWSYSETTLNRTRQKWKCCRATAGKRPPGTGRRLKQPWKWLAGGLEMVMNGGTKTGAHWQAGRRWWRWFRSTRCDRSPDDVHHWVMYWPCTTHSMPCPTIYHSISSISVIANTTMWPAHTWNIRRQSKFYILSIF